MARDGGPRGGPIAWMVRHRVAPNLLMTVLVLGGLFMAKSIRQEVFPEFSLDRVLVSVPYPGASPEEVEQSIVLAVEEAVRAIDGIDEVNATAGDGSASIDIELLEDTDVQRVFQDVQQAVARIRTFPEDAEEPRISLSLRRREVLAVQLFGDVGERVLRELAEQVRDRLLLEPGITQVDLLGARAPEIQVEVSQADLRRYGLTLEGIARLIGATSVDVPGGSVETAGGEILLRVKERRDWAREFAAIPAVSTREGTQVRLGDLARVREGFEEAHRSAVYDGLPAIGLGVYRIGDETPGGVSRAARRAMRAIEADLPPGVDYAIQRDRSEIYDQRMSLLLRNAALGLALVLCVLGVFLETRLAFWVTAGIPTAFLGAFLLLPDLGVTLNMVSMFAFLIALGIVVDDAIVVGENVHEYRERGMPPETAAVEGARRVAMPITFSIATNIVAFLPLMFVPGVLGKIWASIPLVVGTVFVISWVESLFVLPAHLAHLGRSRGGPLARLRDRFRRRFARFVETVYAPFLAASIRARYVTVALGFALLIVVVAWALSGRMGLILMPKVESDRAEAVARLPYGSPDAATEAVRDRLVTAAAELAAAHGGDELVSGVFAVVDENTVEASIYLTDPEVRPLSTARVTELWRESVGPIAGVESLRFLSDAGGPGSGAGLTVELSHRGTDVLDRASAALAVALEQFSNTSDIDDGYTPGKPQLDFRLRPEGRALGLTSTELARQVRASFYGAEALRQQRGRSEIRVMVRLSESERGSEYDIENMLIRTPSGRDVPLREVAEVERGRAHTAITRRQGRRTVTVTADVTPVDEVNQVLATLRAEILPALVRDFPGLAYSFEGRQAEMRESIAALGRGFGIAMLAIYALLAVPFRSYLQPAIVMLAIPFGVVGAIAGHFLMGYSLSVISMMGIVALAGVVVNDSLILIDHANRRRAEGASPSRAIRDAGVRRFRPILLTTLTTFGGLAPMIFETSRQARFMIPMAISLGYGIVFATGITLVLVPSLYLTLDDLRGALRRRWRGATATGASGEAGAAAPVPGEPVRVGTLRGR